MNPYLNWGEARAAELLAEARQHRLARQARRPRTPRWWNVLPFLRPAGRARLT